MPRYIDAEKLIKHIMENSAHWQKNEWYTVGALAAIARTPTADVQEIKHGHWRKTEYAWSICSNCLSTPKMYSPFNYCPICGAKMDEKEKEEIDDTDSKASV